MTSAKDAAYALGDGEPERRRLMLQARFIAELTREVFARAGLAPGMRVLDVGCGVGDVSLLAREFVGAGDSVLGVDRSAHSLTLARTRAHEAGCANLQFVEAGLDSLPECGPFDALVGRLILLYLPDPAQSLRRVLERVRPGGLVVFHEMDMTAARSVPACPLYTRVGEWLTSTFARAGVDVLMGSHLYATFRAAGLAPQLWASHCVAGGDDNGIYEWLAATLGSLMPIAEQLGVTARDEVQLETLASRLRAEVAAGGGVIHSPVYVGAWARKPE
jgi:2-polyprenyl-3-methyl-5-hydroxy-6-metoxy-1,4-benzoquinol methylase